LAQTTDVLLETLPPEPCMIYYVRSKKFQSYLRELTKYEKVKLVYNTEIAKSMSRQVDGESKEVARHYADWGRDLPGLYMELADHPWFLKRKIDEERKEQHRWAELVGDREILDDQACSWHCRLDIVGVNPT
jgi:hypothetical protein